jgi:hypothetical protein
MNRRYKRCDIIARLLLKVPTLKKIRQSMSSHTAFIMNLLDRFSLSSGAGNIDSPISHSITVLGEY